MKEVKPRPTSVIYVTSKSPFPGLFTDPRIRRWR